MHIASYIDHTILKPTTSYIEITKICKEAVQYGFAAVCVPPPFVRKAREVLEAVAEERAREDGKAIEPELPGVATVIGFPFGYSNVNAKLAETAQAIADGADELDVVLHLIALKRADWEYLEWEMRSITDLIHGQKKIVKVIIESGVLSNQEIIRCCELYSKIGVDFLKTSTGYAEKGATVEAVQLMREHLPVGVRIKASGGIRNYHLARQLIEAGADRLGCSASVDIVKGEVAAAEGIEQAGGNAEGEY